MEEEETEDGIDKEIPFSVDQSTFLCLVVKYLTKLYEEHTDRQKKHKRHGS
jgi:hypothetical protein